VDDFDESYDQRRFRRVRTNVPARVNFDGYWHNCNAADLSGGGAFFFSRLQPQIHSNVLIQIRGVGMVRARVVHRKEEGFSVEFNDEDIDQDAIVDNLTLVANKGLLEGKNGDDLDEDEFFEELTDDSLPEYVESEGPSGKDLLEPLKQEAEESGTARRRHPLRARTQSGG